MWLEAAAGVLPRQALLAAQEAACDEGTWAQMQAACAPGALSRHQLLGASETAPVQHLFNIYVHALPNFTGVLPLHGAPARFLGARPARSSGPPAAVRRPSPMLECLPARSCGPLCSPAG